MRQSWEDRVAAVAAHRSVSAYRMAVSGFGQPVDRHIWPVLDRFGALGIPTVGSCEGHFAPGNPQPPSLFVSVDSGPEPALRHRWLAVVDELLQPVVMGAPIRLSVGVMDVSVDWHHIPEDFPTEQSRVLTILCDKLDAAGRRLVADTSVDDWAVWVIPDLEVPDGVDPTRMGMAFVEFLSQQDPRVDRIVRNRLDGFDWPRIAGAVHSPESQCRQAWEAFWDDWLQVQQKSEGSASA